MARATITLPDRYVFSTEITARITDINYGNHLANDALLGMMHEARLRFLNHFGFSEKDVEGYGIIMADAVIVYKSQVYYGENLIFDITANDFGKRACDLIYRITAKSTGKEVARAKTRIAFFDYDLQKTVGVPSGFKEIFKDF